MSGPIRANRLKKVIERDGPLCAWCSFPLSADHDDATVDHALPYAKDGSNRTVNLLLACDACNGERGNTSLGRFRQRMVRQGYAVQHELIDAAIARRGSFPLSCTPEASREQTLACYPQLPAFLAEKRRIDPAERLTNRWYWHYRSLFARQDCAVRWAS